MASALRSYAQIPSRVKYFLWTGVDASTNPVPAASAFQLDEGEYALIGSMATAAEVTAKSPVTNPFAVSPPGLLKDMGRQITIYDAATRLHLAVYRQVQIVDGVDSEGVGGTAPAWESNYFVKVWSADGLGVEVFRTG